MSVNDISVLLACAANICPRKSVARWLKQPHDAAFAKDVFEAFIWNLLALVGPIGSRKLLCNSLWWPN